MCELRNGEEVRTYAMQQNHTALSTHPLSFASEARQSESSMHNEHSYCPSGSRQENRSKADTVCADHCNECQYVLSLQLPNSPRY